MNILLTGGTGFLGRSIIEYFSKRHKIYAAYRNSKGATKRNVKWIHIDLTEINDFKNAQSILREAGIDVIIHAGGATPNRAYADGNFDSTTIGTKNLVETAKILSIRKIIFISSISVLFSKGPYAASKKEAERTIISSDLDYVILRPETMIGPGAKDFNRVADMIAKHRIFPIIGSGNNTTQPIASIDVLRMIEKTLSMKKLNNKIYPAVGRDILTTKDMLQKISDAKGKNITFMHIPLWLAYAASWIAGRVYPRLGLNCERVRIMSYSRHYSLEHLKDFGIRNDSLKSFDDMICFLKMR
jgi:nucleoside-diphosphate-sugar epimerase